MLRVIFQISHTTGRIAGAWWEIGDFDDQELDCAYVEPFCMETVIGVEQMLAKPRWMPWHDYWAYLADHVSPVLWWEVAEVDAESYAYELLFKTWTCNPRSVLPRRPDGWGTDG